MKDDELRNLLAESAAATRLHFDAVVDRIRIQVDAVEGRTQARFDQVDARFAAAEESTQARFDQVDTRFVAVEDKMLSRIQDSEERTRRHFDVVAESMRSDVQQVAEGLGMMRQEMNQRFADVDHEFTETRSLIKLSYSQLDRRVEVLEHGNRELGARVRTLENRSQP